jgi:hypothetical protein
MKFNNLHDLAKAVSLDILITELDINKKFPINDELRLDISKLPDDENGDMAREDPEEFMRLVNISIHHKLNYMYEEGFLAKKKGYYRAYTKAELDKQIKELEDSND